MSRVTSEVYLVAKSSTLNLSGSTLRLAHSVLQSVYCRSMKILLLISLLFSIFSVDLKLELKLTSLAYFHSKCWEEHIMDVYMEIQRYFKIISSEGYYKYKD